MDRRYKEIIIKLENYLKNTTAEFLYDEICDDENIENVMNIIVLSHLYSVLSCITCFCKTGNKLNDELLNMKSLVEDSINEFSSVLH